VLMLLSLYSANTKAAPVPRKDDGERPLTNGLANGHPRIPNAADRQAADAQEFELEGLMSDDDDVEGGATTKGTNGHPR
ncbi:hypothetical protein LTR95_019080, partial [Oleoguttula sp. CCFEE 5521]